jgi:NAD(P)-dependent dehydrogenase (short-subunit alcohol dehydrogenase family)
MAGFASLGEITEEHFDRIFGTNVRGCSLQCKSPCQLCRDGAPIILNASIDASKGLPKWKIYSATKAAMRLFARIWRTRLKSYARPPGCRCDDR